MTKFIILILCAIIFIAVAPIVTIWALNTIFPSLNIPITLWTYLAMAWLQSFIYYKHTSK